MQDPRFRRILLWKCEACENEFIGLKKLWGFQDENI
jgi:hypothetical protein